MGITAGNESVKKMIESNLSLLEDALEANGVDAKELKIEKINFSNNKAETADEMKSLVEKAASGDFNPKSDEGLLTDDMKDFVSLFLKSKSGSSKDLSTAFQTFNSAITQNLNAEVDSVIETIPAQKIIDTVVKKISQSVSEGKSQIEIKLVPENLGKLTVKIISEEGKLSANIEVKNLEVKQAIDAGIVKLKDNLGQNGILVDQINVSLSEDYYSRSHQERFFEQGNGQSEENGNGNFETSDIEDAELVRRLGYNTLEYIA